MGAVGAGAARELFLTGEAFGAVHAKAIGLVSNVVPEDQLDALVLDRIDALRAAGPEAQAGIKRLLPSIVGLEAGTHERTARLTAERRGSAEGREGLSSFLERRRPSWNATPADRERGDEDGGASEGAASRDAQTGSGTTVASQGAAT